jgi:hypothetical protein
MDTNLCGIGISDFPQFYSEYRHRGGACCTGVLEEGVGVRSRLGAVRTILLFISLVIGPLNSLSYGTHLPTGTYTA